MVGADVARDSSLGFRGSLGEVTESSTDLMRFLNVRYSLFRAVVDAVRAEMKDLGDGRVFPAA